MGAWSLCGDARMLVVQRPYVLLRCHFAFGKIRFMPPQLREIGCHVENHATQWHDFQHEIQFQEIGVAWIQLTLVKTRHAI